MRRMLLLSVAALLSVLVGPHAKGAPSSEVTVEVRILGPKGETVPEGGDIVLGQEVTLEIRLQAPEDTTFFVPSNPSLDPFRLVGTPEAPSRHRANGRLEEVHRMKLLPLRMGAKAIPPIELPYRRGDDEGATASTARHRIHIRGHLDNEQDPALGAAPATVPVIATNWWLVWGTALGGGALFATLLTLLVLRLLRDQLDALVPGPPPPPADVVALAALRELEVAAVDRDARYTGACDVLRAYLGGRYGFDGMEHTTEEMMRALDTADLKGAEPASVRRILEDVDLVKFARLTPTDQQGHDLIAEARALVLQTWEPPPENEREEPVLFEPASLEDRMRAGALDVGLAFALALVLLTGLWAGSLEQWAWVPVLAAGVVLVFRDAGGRSPGKIWMGLQVVSTHSVYHELSPTDRIRRNLTLLVAPLGLPAETLFLWRHPLGHRLGDQWAGTHVVTPIREVP